jgi:hypothetical protein
VKVNSQALGNLEKRLRTMTEERWQRAVENARFMIEEYRKIPMGMIGATFIAYAISRYESGERTHDLLEELESIH